MPAEANDIVDKLILNQNAYFYRQIHSLSHSGIEQLFREVSRDKLKNRFMLKRVRESVQIGSRTILYSLCVFKYEKRPSFLNESFTGWNEIKFSFLLIIEYSEFVVIVKKNISGLRAIEDYIEPLDYGTISHLFVSNSTAFEKFFLSNMNTADNAIRNKSIEAVNLRGVISPIEACKKVINSMRIDNSGEKTSLSLGTSRINRIGDKRSLMHLLQWIVNTCEMIRSFAITQSFLDNFARPLKFLDFRDSLEPIGILIKLERLKSEIENGFIDRIFEMDDEGNEREVDVFQHLACFDTICEVQQTSNSREFKISNRLDPEMLLKINEKSITIDSDALKNIKIDKGESRVFNLNQYLNWGQGFIVNFSNPELIYSFRKLFKDHQLLNSVDNFLSVFKPISELLNVNSEKGTPYSLVDTGFTPESIFGIVEEHIANEANYLICDDLGNEWADHIAIYDDAVHFYHSKFKESVSLGGSNLHDVIAQAQKNLGNLDPSEEILRAKKSSWESNYANSGINRLRKGESVDAAIEAYLNVLVKPNRKKRVYIVVNFISKVELAEALQNLQQGASFLRKKEVVQILWLVSSLVASCTELNIELFVLCSA